MARHPKIASHLMNHSVLHTTHGRRQCWGGNRSQIFGDEVDVRKSSPENRKLRESVNPGRPNAVFDLESALKRGISKEDIVNITFEELVKKKVRFIAVNFSVSALEDVVGGEDRTFRALVKRTSSVLRQRFIVNV